MAPGRFVSIWFQFSQGVFMRFIFSRTTQALACLALFSACSAQTTSAPATAPAATPATTPATAKEASAQTTASGLIYSSLKDGTGASPLATDTVKVHYKGTFPDGKEFDSSYSRNAPTEFPLNRVIPCWTEGVQLMKTGGKAKLVCPPAIAYGARGAGGVIPPNATLHFEIELLAINGK
jgi:FKBP-type peptidyl-prolyl cis-trans isomerase FkpA